MDRIIKFRAWDKEYAYMYQTAYPFEHLVYVEMFDDDETFQRFKHKMQVVNGKYFYWIIAKDIELMQFTGLQDKNGKEIYEGDFLRVDWQDSRYPVHTIGPVTWDTEESRWSLGEGGWAKHDAEGYMEVIGNVYETPGLLTNSKLTS